MFAQDNDLHVFMRILHHNLTVCVIGTITILRQLKLLDAKLYITSEYYDKEDYINIANNGCHNLTKKTDDEKNIDKYGVAANIILYQVASLFTRYLTAKGITPDGLKSIIKF